MERLFEAIGAVNTPGKPRQVGLTSVLDSGLGPRLALDMLEMAGEWVDVVKLGWCTIRLQPADKVLQKINAYRKAGVSVCVGGSMLEVAYCEGKLDDFLSSAAEAGLDLVEVSNGFSKMTQSEKADIIGQMRAAGFRVWSEVGRKDSVEDRRIDLVDRVSAIVCELKAGAEKVILEAREGGTSGIFNADGSPRRQLLGSIVEAVGLESLVLEAPRKDQQVWLVKTYGPEVSLGNIPPDQVVSLASIRAGLRADTFGLRGEPLLG